MGQYDEEKLWCLMKAGVSEPKIAVVAWFVLAGGLQMGGLDAVRSLEPIGYEIALALLVAIVGVMLISGSFRLWAIWTELRRLLLALDGLPLRRAFKRINVVSWSPLWRMGAGSDADFRRLLSMEYEAFARVTQATAAPHPAAAPATGPTPQQQLRASYELAMDNWLDAKGSPAHRFGQRRRSLSPGDSLPPCPAFLCWGECLPFLRERHSR